MKYDKSVSLTWLKSMETYLPDVFSAIEAIDEEVIILGACVFDLYNKQGWVPKLTRKTGDLDLSLGVSSTSNQYEKFVELLLDNSYQRDEEHPYRYHPPKPIPGAIAFVDVLAHPTVTGEDEVAKKAMGVKGQFNLEGVDFAKLESFEITERVSFPNPIAFANLKRLAYLDDPNRRKKDLADIVELGSGLVRTGTHFEISGIWNSLRHREEASEVKDMYHEIAEDVNPRWEIWEVESDLLSRGYLENELESTLLQELKDLATIGMN